MSISSLQNQMIALTIAGAEKLRTFASMGKDIARHGAAFGDQHDDTELKADIDLGAYYHDALAGFPSVNRITVEGRGSQRLGSPDSAKYWVTVDPLDGSLNYRFAERGVSLPYTACFTILRDVEDATFADIQASIVYDYRDGTSWSAIRGAECKLNGANACRISRTDTKIDIGSMILIAEMYYPENRERILRAFAGEKGWIRNPGSAAYEMMLVASGQASAFVCDRQKMHELGAGYLAVREAGGVAVDFTGRSLDGVRYDFDAKQAVILAANPYIAEDLVKRLSR